MDLGIYLHIPFCRRKCSYCDFFSLAGEADLAAYTGLLLRELELATGELALPVPVDTVYFGGGTPSLLAPAEVGSLLQAIDQRLGLAAETEVTIEANPGTVTLASLAGYRAAGVNRLSLGVQSLDDAMLARLGRLHSAAEARAAVAAARQAGFANLGLDLIHGLPGQDLDHWRSELAGLVELAPEHVSAYGLTLEPGTPLAAAVAAGELPLPDEETAARCWELAAELLPAAGYRQYEIANYARPDRESRHNRRYWRRQPTLGLGAGAHSFLATPAWGVRWHAPADLAAWEAGLSAGRLPMREYQQLSRAEAVAEALFLGLRQTAGIDLAEFAAAYGVTVDAAFPGLLPRLEHVGLLDLAAGRLALSRHGLLLANQVLAEFLEPVLPPAPSG